MVLTRRSGCGIPFGNGQARNDKVSLVAKPTQEKQCFQNHLPDRNPNDIASQGTNQRKGKNNLKLVSLK